MCSTSMMDITVSTFIVNTCRVCPRPNNIRWRGLRLILAKPEDYHENDMTHITNRTLSGSASELYIDPMLPCIGDLDVMFYRSDQLVVPQRHHVTDYVQLPVEFHTSDEIKLCELIDTEYPGFVFIRLIGNLIKSGNNGEYKFQRTTVEYYTTYTIPSDGVRHGPADVLVNASKLRSEIGGRRYETVLSADFVYCIRCLEWPPQAVDWPTRIREYGWPDTATIQRVVNNGCDLVVTAHHQCKHNELYNTRMFRISFSRAETILLNSWSPTQQIVYHLLRYVIKKTSFIESADQLEQSKCRIFNNYHLKTLMLWSCERRSQQWWTLSLVRITTQLLHTLANLLIAGEFQQYFITRCKLFDHLNYFDSFEINFVFSTLSSVTDESLSEWIIENYIRECAQLCPDDISELMNNVSTTAQLQYALSSIVNWRVDHYHELSVREFNGILSCGQADIRKTRSAHLHVNRPFIEALREVDERLSDFFIALIFFIALMKQRRDIFEIVKVIHELMQCNESNVSRQTKSRSSSTNTSFTKATNILMKLKTEVNRDKMLQVELAKAFFHMSLEDTDAHQVHEDCLARVYLASLYHSSGQYQTAIDQFLSATKSSQTQSSSHVVESQLLPDNDNIHIVSGLIVLYQFIIRSRTSSQQHTQHIAVFDPKLFSFFHIIKCLGRIKTMNTSVVHETLRCYQWNIRHSESLFIGDVLLIYFVMSNKVKLYSRRSTCCKTVSNSEPSVFNTFRLRCLLMKSAVERLTAVRHVMSRDYGPPLQVVVTSDYAAMYAYKCGEYEHCLHLCQDNVNSFLGATRVTPSVSLPSSDLLLLMDDDCLSLVGLCALGRVYDEYYYLHVTQISLSLYLVMQCKVKLNHSPKSFIHVLHNIIREYRRWPVDWITDRLLLTLSYRRARRTIH